MLTQEEKELVEAYWALYTKKQKDVISHAVTITAESNIADTVKLESGSVAVESDNFVSDKESGFRLSEDQQRALEVLQSGESVFLTGKAGTGKSFVIKKFMEASADKNIMVCAPTGIAAINVHGTTLHRAFDIPVQVLTKTDYTFGPSDAVKQAEVIIIDEVSMCRIDIFEYVMRTLRLNRLHPQIILVGDFAQLPPVVTPKDKDILEKFYADATYGLSEGVPFLSEEWKSLNLRYAYLTTVHRQSDPGFLDALNAIRLGDSAGLNWFKSRVKAQPKQSVCLCGTNKLAEKINMEKLVELDTEEFIFKTRKAGKVLPADMNVPESLTVKVGARVVLLKNDPKGYYQNGSLGTITDITEIAGEPALIIELDNGRIVDIKQQTTDVLAYEIDEDGNLVTNNVGSYTQFPLKIAYAITIHKSQGQTYDHVHVFPNCFAPGQLYVALSRATSPEALTLSGNIPKKSLMTLPAVRDFDKFMRGRAKEELNE